MDNAELAKNITKKEFDKLIEAACGDWKDKLFDKFGKDIYFKGNADVSVGQVESMFEAASQDQHRLLTEMFGKPKDFQVGDLVKLIALPKKDSWILTNNYEIGSYFVIMADKAKYHSGMMHKLGTLEGRELGGLPDRFMEKVTLWKPKEGFDKKK